MPLLKNTIRNIYLLSRTNRLPLQLQKTLFWGHYIRTSCHRSASRHSNVCPATPALTQITRTANYTSQAGSDTVIYEGSLTRSVRIIKLFSISTSSIVLCAQPWLYRMAVAGEASPTVALAMSCVCAAFIAGTPLLLHWVTKRYVTQIRFDQPNRSFTVSTLSLLARKKEMPFVAADVSPLHVPSAFCNVKIKDKLLLIDPAAFTDRNAYIHMMGYDEPMDLHLPPSGESQKASSETRKRATSKE